MQESLKGKKVLTFGVTMTIGEYAIVPALSRLSNTSGHGFSHPIWQHPDSAHLSL